MHISELTPGPSGTQRQSTPGTSQSHQRGPQKRSSGGSVTNLAVCLSHSPFEIWPNIHFVFYPAVSSPRKRKRQATADPDSETTSSSDSDSSSTVDTSTSEGEDEKDFILPDYLSDELTSSKSSDSEPEEAPAENLSMGWSERDTRVDTHFHGAQNIPDYINHESTTLSFLELFLDADFWGLLCLQTNLRAEQVKQSKPTSYYAKNFKPVAVNELKAFLGLRLQMKCVIKPCYESYWQWASHNFIAHTPWFQGSHGTRPLLHPLGLPALGRSDERGLGQVRQDLQSQAHAQQIAPSLSPLLQPRQQLSSTRP